MNLSPNETSRRQSVNISISWQLAVLLFHLFLPLTLAVSNIDNDGSVSSSTSTIRLTFGTSATPNATTESLAWSPEVYLALGVQLALIIGIFLLVSLFLRCYCYYHPDKRNSDLENAPAGPRYTVDVAPLSELPERVKHLTVAVLVNQLVVSDESSCNESEDEAAVNHKDIDEEKGDIETQTVVDKVENQTPNEQLQDEDLKENENDIDFSNNNNASKLMIVENKLRHGLGCRHNDEDRDCPICLEPVHHHHSQHTRHRTLLQTPCCHQLLHKDCVLQWLDQRLLQKEQKTTTLQGRLAHACPWCRGALLDPHELVSEGAETDIETEHHQQVPRVIVDPPVWLVPHPPVFWYVS